MKKFFRFALVALMAATAVVSCKDNKEPETPAEYKGPEQGTSAWSVIGSLLDTNWDTDFVCAEQDGVFVLKNVKLAKGNEFKFRENKAWDNAYKGVFAELGKGFEVDNEPGGNNIKPELEGIYDLYLNLTDSQAAICAAGKAPQWTAVEKSNAAKIVSFSLKSGDVTIEGEVFDDDKVVEIQYNPEHAALVANATAVYEISPKATISPDPATITDWTNHVELTVTAQDGTTKNVYTVEAIPAEFTVAIAPVAGVDGKLLTDLGANNDIVNYGGNQIAFAGTKNIVTCDGRVYDLDFKYVGDLNLGEIGAGAIMGLTNDDNGIVIAAVGYGDAEYSAAPVDGDGAVTWNYTNSTRFFAWKDGWDKAPVKFYENGSRLMYINASGDFNGAMLMTAKQGVNEGGNGNHHLFHFQAGVVDGSKWAWFETHKAEIGIGGEQNFTSGAWRLGASAGSVACPVGTDKNDALFVYAQALSALSVEDPNYATNVTDKWGKDGNAGMIVAARQGYTGTDLILEGTAETVNGKTKPHRYGGLYGWGNHCITGGIKAFQYNGTAYVGVAGSNWNETHFTVVDITASAPGSTAAILATTSDNTGKMAGGGLGSVAYIYDPETDSGHIAVLFATPGNDVSSEVRRFELTREKK